MASIAVSCGNCGGQAMLGTELCPGCGQTLAILDYAGFQLRFFAYLIDAAVLTGVQIALIIFVESMTFVFIASAAIGLVYTVGFWLTDGATPGKMAMGIQILSADGSPLEPGQALLRYLGYILSGIILGAGYLMIAFSEEKRGLHDLIAGTIVVRKG